MEWLSVKDNPPPLGGRLYLVLEVIEVAGEHGYIPWIARWDGERWTTDIEEEVVVPVYYLPITAPDGERVL